MKRHTWDIYEDMKVYSHVKKGDIKDKRVINDLCKEFGIDPTQLSARANNFEHIAHGKTSFWKTSKSEREAYRLLEKHDALIL